MTELRKHVLPRLYKPHPGVLIVFHSRNCQNGKVSHVIRDEKEEKKKLASCSKIPGGKIHSCCGGSPKGFCGYCLIIWIALKKKQILPV